VLREIAEPPARGEPTDARYASCAARSAAALLASRDVGQRAWQDAVRPARPDAGRHAVLRAPERHGVRADFARLQETALKRQQAPEEQRKR
jgi:hypothetical protein